MVGEGDAKSTVKSTFGGALRAIGKYLAPLIGVVAGYFSGRAIGGAPSLSGPIGNILGGGSNAGGGANGWRASYAIMALIWGGVGAIFWSIRGGGMWHEIIGGLLGGLFFGMALYNAVGIFQGQGSAGGALDNLIGSTTSAVGGG
jgi:hypothetical protein